MNKNIEQGNFFGVGIDQRNSTDKFRQVTPLKDRHQVFICSESNEIILFVPSLKHTENVFPQKRNKGRVQNKKCYKLWKKSIIFLTPHPLPYDNLDFFDFGKKLILTPPHTFGHLYI